MGWSVKIKWIQGDEWGNIWVGSEIICLKPCIVVRESICVPCKVVMSSDHHAGDLALGSPKTTIIETCFVISINDLIRNSY